MEKALLSLNQLQVDGNNGSLGYIPSMGWKPGLYTFQAELHEDAMFIQSMESRQLMVTPESVTKVVSWKTLGVIIVSTFVFITILVALVLYRKREMLHGYNE